MNAKAVALAKDVLKQMKNWHIQQGVYLIGESLDENVIIKTKKHLQEEILDLSKKCEVCALRACFLSYIHLYDDVTPTDVIFCSRDQHRQRTLSSCRRNINKNLLKVFDQDTIYAVELAFEATGKIHGLVKKDSLHPYNRAIAFGRKYKTNTRRLKAIMNNIINNEGHFIP